MAPPRIPPHLRPALHALQLPQGRFLLLLELARAVAASLTEAVEYFAAPDVVILLDEGVPFHWVRAEAVPAWLASLQPLQPAPLRKRAQLLELVTALLPAWPADLVTTPSMGTATEREAPAPN